MRMNQIDKTYSQLDVARCLPWLAPNLAPAISLAVLTSNP